MIFFDKDNKYRLEFTKLTKYTKTTKIYKSHTDLTDLTDFLKKTTKTLLRIDISFLDAVSVADSV